MRRLLYRPDAAIGIQRTGLRVGQDAQPTGVVCFSTHVAPLGLVKHNTYRRNGTQIPVTYELTSLAFCASGKMPDLRVVLVMAYGARAISHVVLLGLTRNNA